MKRQSNKKEIKDTNIEEIKTSSSDKAHNRAVWAFNNANRIMVWTAILNIIGLMLTIIIANFGNLSEPEPFIQASFFYSTIVKSSYKYGLSYSFTTLINRILELPKAGSVGGLSLSFFVFLLLLVVFGILVSAIAVFISIKASRQAKWAIYAQSIFYTLDTLLILVLLILGEYMISIWIMLGIHVFVLTVSWFQVFEYHKILKYKENKLFKGEE